MVQSIWKFQETPPTHRILIDFSSTPPMPFFLEQPLCGFDILAFMQNQTFVKNKLLINKKILEISLWFTTMTNAHVYDLFLH